MEEIEKNKTAKQANEASELNALLCDLNKVYDVDGDIMRCRECGNGIIASRIEETLPHKKECSQHDDDFPDGGTNPWMAMKVILMNYRSALHN